MKNPFLVGEQVYLRPLELTDAAAIVPWMNDVEVTRSLKIARPMNLETERAYIERVTKSENDVAVAIMTRASDRFIGTAALMQINWRESHAAFGISIGEKSHWGRGHGTETARLLAGHAFEALNLNRVWLHVFDFNTAGMRAYEKAGFRLEGILRQATFVEGEYRDVHAMAILRDEWMAAPQVRKQTGRTPAPRPATVAPRRARGAAMAAPKRARRTAR